MGESRGTVLVELAFALPILALVFLITIDLGLAMREHQLLQNAAREGARFSCLPWYRISPTNPGITEDIIKQHVIDYCQQEGITVNAVDIFVDQDYRYELAPGGPLVVGSLVEVRSTHRMLILGAPILPNGNISLSGRAVFQNIR
jgi:hypothetical protein